MRNPNEAEHRILVQHGDRNDGPGVPTWPRSDISPTASRDRAAGSPIATNMGRSRAGRKQAVSPAPTLCRGTPAVAHATEG